MVFLQESPSESVKVWDLLVPISLRSWPCNFHASLEHSLHLPKRIWWYLIFCTFQTPKFLFSHFRLGVLYPTHQTHGLWGHSPPPAQRRGAAAAVAAAALAAAPVAAANEGLGRLSSDAGTPRDGRGLVWKPVLFFVFFNVVSLGLKWFSLVYVWLQMHQLVASLAIVIVVVGKNFSELVKDWKLQAIQGRPRSNNDKDLEGIVFECMLRQLLKTTCVRNVGWCKPSKWWACIVCKEQTLAFSCCLVKPNHFFLELLPWHDSSFPAVFHSWGKDKQQPTTDRYGLFDDLLTSEPKYPCRLPPFSVVKMEGGTSAKHRRCCSLSY